MKGNCFECSLRWTCEIDPDYCNEWPDPVPMSNAGRIRSISDEELADALQKFCIGMVDCSDCPLYAFGCPMSSTFNDWLEWLHKPAGIA